MSSVLVDYGSSSDEEDEQELSQPPEPEPRRPAAADRVLEESTSNGASTRPSQTQPVLLPDASELFGPSEGGLLPTSVATTTAGSGTLLSGKRPGLNGSAQRPQERKLPRRNFPDTAGNLLLPPQLRGRSNVVTDDMDKLFVRKPR